MPGRRFPCSLSSESRSAIDGTARRSAPLDDIDHHPNGVRDMPLLDLFFTMFWFFLFIAWIWLLISVYADVFRSDDLGGLGKAVWVLFVLLLPYLGVLIYLVARGGKMQERAAVQAQQSRRATEYDVREIAGPTSTADELAKLGQLREQGVLSPSEFDTQKAKLLTMS
jgi:hypothetical protein